MANYGAPPVPGGLISVATLQTRYPELSREKDPETLVEIIQEATAHMEDMTSRRMAPFNNVTFSDRLHGIDPDEYGDTNADMPLSFAGSLGSSYASALGNSDLVRHFWVDQFAPLYPELWTYTVTNVTITLTYGNTVAVDFQSGGMIGPDPNDGHVWLRLGTFSPEGSRINLTYSGGYTVGTPASLRRACLYQCAKFLILEAEPTLHDSQNTDMLDAQTVRLLAPWARG